MGILVIEKQDLKHNIKQIKEYAKKDNEKLKIKNVGHLYAVWAIAYLAEQ